MAFGWWQLGEGSGYDGDELGVHRITCPFCLERGNFQRVAEFTKRKANARKVLHFDTYKCGNCVGYVMVLWSASSSGLGGLHDFRVLPWPTELTKYPDHWPEEVGRFWLQAQRNITEENWDAAAVMARSSMQSALRNQGARGANLRQEIDDLATKGVLPPHMREWAHELRELGNDSAHPSPGQPPTAAKDARAIAEFLSYLLEYLYTLPHNIAEYRKSK